MKCKKLAQKPNGTDNKSSSKCYLDLCYTNRQKNKER